MGYILLTVRFRVFLMETFKKLSSQILVDLKDTEGDYRVSSLPLDKAQAIFSLIFVGFCIVAMLWVDWLLFKEEPKLFRLMALYRGGFILFTAVFAIAISRTNKVRIFDRLVLVWISALLAFLLLFNFTRPANYLTTVFDIITIFAVYVLSPLKIYTNFLLTFCFSLATLYIDHFLKSGVNLVALDVADSAHLIVHLLGLGSSYQLQSYRRKAFKAFMDEKDAREMVAYLANIDPLTKSLTRRQFFNIAESEFLRFRRYRRPLSVMIMDADLFKAINDTYGNHAGDLALRSLSLVAMEQKRAQDTFGRLGGEEFALLMPETGLEQAVVVAERIRQMWSQSPVNLDGEMIHSTISIGVAEASEADEVLEDILRRADQMMYKAKEQGRNRVMSA